MSVLLRLEGPLQSWGTRSRFADRDTEDEPSKSGVLGLVGAALGMPRDDDAMLARLAAARMGVRVDRRATLLRDYHTVGGGAFRGRPHSVHGANGTVLTQRAYLQDASFLVALGYRDHALAAAIDQALGAPRWPLFLGRRACAPSLPVRAGLAELEPEAALRRAPWPSRAAPVERVGLVVECAHGEGEAHQDQPLTFRPNARHFARRFVRRTWIEPEALTLPLEAVTPPSIVALARRPGR